MEKECEMPELDNLVKVTLDKERHLRLTLKGMLEFEKLTGKNLIKGFKLEDLGLADTAAMMWACLLHEDKELTYDDVLCMIDFDNLESALDALMDCLTHSLPEPKAGDIPLAKTPQLG